jgi:hypothetical protein
MGFGDILDVLWAIFLIGGAAVSITWMVVMNKAVDQVSHDFRRMEPGAVWLSLIPVFGFVWNFLVTNAVAEGIAKELHSRNIMPREAKPGYSIGLSGNILLCCCLIPYAGVVIAIVGLVLMIIHTVRINEYNQVIQQTGRWETRYHQRMEAMRQQRGITGFGYGTAQHWTPPPIEPPPPPTIQPPPSYYNPAEVNPYQRKDKPKNPFE